ncbi:MAG: response regulator [Caulobacteraceae bacterium]|nr:response regulator [Caulobacter sp.]
MAAKQIARQAPYMRRFARALTGDQAPGDILVQGAMEGLLANPSQLDGELPLRLALFRALYRAWREHPTTTQGFGGQGADHRLQTLSPEHRAALLLCAMEGFTPDEAAQIMELSPEALAERLAEAQAELGRQLATDVLIIEDEPIIALDLTRVVRELGHNVSGVAATHEEAVKLAGEARPGLILADVRLADGSNGMDAAREILQRVDAPVIFITAFPEHLLTGEGPEPVFLVTKPFREETVRALVGQALFFHSPRETRPSA